jgi:acetyl esterase/lipase
VSVSAAPARATDLAGLPQSTYAGALWTAGVQAELHVWPGAFHGSTSMMPEAVLSRRATSALREWTGRLLGSAV